MLNIRIVEYVEDNKLIAKEQAGFRKRFRTISHIYSFYVRSLTRSSDRIWACLVDFQNAVDILWYDALLLDCTISVYKGNLFRLPKTCTGTQCVYINDRFFFQ